MENALQKYVFWIDPELSLGELVYPLWGGGHFLGRDRTSGSVIQFGKVKQWINESKYEGCTL